MPSIVFNGKKIPANILEDDLAAVMSDTKDFCAEPCIFALCHRQDDCETCAFNHVNDNTLDGQVWRWSLLKSYLNSTEYLANKL